MGEQICVFAMLSEESSNPLTGPRTPEGKAMVSRNAWKGGHRAQLRALSKELNAELAAMRRFNRMALA